MYKGILFDYNSNSILELIKDQGSFIIKIDNNSLWAGSTYPP
jgi:hypothetical protein